jgi:hypothetical protein
MAFVEESDIGMYGLKVWNEHGEAYCEAKLVYDGLEVQPGQTLGDCYMGFDKYTVSGLPMPNPDKPLITQMSDTHVTLTWKPALPLGPNLAPYYVVEMAEYPDGDWTEMYEDVSNYAFFSVILNRPNNYIVISGTSLTQSLTICNVF